MGSVYATIRFRLINDTTVNITTMKVPRHSWDWHDWYDKDDSRPNLFNGCTLEAGETKDGTIYPLKTASGTPFTLELIFEDGTMDTCRVYVEWVRYYKCNYTWPQQISYYEGDHIIYINRPSFPKSQMYSFESCLFRGLEHTANFDIIVMHTPEQLREITARRIHNEAAREAAQKYYLKAIFLFEKALDITGSSKLKAMINEDLYLAHKNKCQFDYMRARILEMIPEIAFEKEPTLYNIDKKCFGYFMGADKEKRLKAAEDLYLSAQTYAKKAINIRKGRKSTDFENADAILTKIEYRIKIFTQYKTTLATLDEGFDDADKAMKDDDKATKDEKYRSATKNFEEALEGYQKILIYLEAIKEISSNETFGIDKVTDMISALTPLIKRFHEIQLEHKMLQVETIGKRTEPTWSGEITRQIADDI